MRGKMPTNAPDRLSQHTDISFPPVIVRSPLGRYATSGLPEFSTHLDFFLPRLKSRFTTQNAVFLPTRMAGSGSRPLPNIPTAAP